MKRTLSVWWDGAVVGTLKVNQYGEMRFGYSPEWLADAARPAISFSLPKRPEPFKQRECRPFFAGLLPEESQRDVIAGALGISKRNDFAFLEALGGLAAPFVRRRVQELADAVVAEVATVAERLAQAGLDADALVGYAALIVARAERVSSTSRP